MEWSFYDACAALYESLSRIAARLIRSSFDPSGIQMTDHLYLAPTAASIEQLGTVAYQSMIAPDAGVYDPLYIAGFLGYHQGIVAQVAALEALLDAYHQTDHDQSIVILDAIDALKRSTSIFRDPYNEGRPPFPTPSDEDLLKGLPVPPGSGHYTPKDPSSHPGGRPRFRFDDPVPDKGALE